VAGDELVRTPAPATGAAFAEASLNLESLSAAFLVEARDFFRACQSHWV
jgi:hypothetical protein